MDEIILAARRILKYWWIIALSTLIAFGVSLIIAFDVEPLYQSSAQYLIVPGESLLASDDLDIVRGIEALDRSSIVATISEIIGNPKMHREVGEALNISNENFSSYEFSTTILPNTSVIELNVSGPDPIVAQQLVRSVGETAVQFIEGRYTVYEIVLLSDANLPTNAYNLNILQDILITTFIGFAIGLGLAFLRTLFMNSTILGNQTGSINVGDVPIMLLQISGREDLSSIGADGQISSQILGSLKEVFGEKDLFAIKQDQNYLLLCPGISSNDVDSYILDIELELELAVERIENQDIIDFSKDVLSEVKTGSF